MLKVFGQNDFYIFLFLYSIPVSSFLRSTFCLCTFSLFCLYLLGLDLFLFHHPSIAGCLPTLHIISTKMSVKLWTLSIFYFSLLVCTYLYFYSLPAESFLYLSLSIRIPYHFFFLAQVFIRLEGDSWLLVGGAAASKAFIYWPSFPTFCCWECRRQEETSSA